MCYYINVSRRRKRTVDGTPLVQVCRVVIDFNQSGAMIEHLAATAFPPTKGYVLELFREDRCHKRIEVPSPNPNTHL